MDEQQLALCTGDERLHFGGEPFGDEQGTATVLDFWRWAFSNVVDDRNRGSLAEFVVARLIGEAHHRRPQTTTYDVCANERVRIEVKSSAYVQAYKETDTVPGFGGLKVRPYRYDDRGRVQYGDSDYQADVYVLALLSERDRQRFDPLDLSQWSFYVLTTAELRATARDRPYLSLRALVHNGIEPCSARHLKNSVIAASQRAAGA